MNVIDRTSAEPYYQQLARIIEGRIRNGTYPSGSRVPGETELCRAFDLSRSTVRETLRALEQQRLIRMVPRRGAFVNDLTGNRWMLQVTQGFLETLSESPGQSIETVVDHYGFEPLPGHAAEALDLPRGSTGFTLRRTRSVDGRPALYSTNWLPEDVGRSLIGQPVLEGRASLNQTLREAGHTIFSARREVAAVAAAQEVAEHLHLARRAPVLLIQSTSRNEHGRAFDYYRSYVRSDVVTISVSAQAGAEPGSLLRAG